MRSLRSNLRSALAGAFFVGYGLAALPFAPLLMLPGWTGRGTRRVIRVFYRLFVGLAARTHLFRVTMDETTRMALRDCRGKVVVANHVSLIDIVILLAFLPDSTVLAKAATLRNPFLGMVVRRGFIPAGDNPEATVALAASSLVEGTNVVVFPEGTRTPPGTQVRRFHRGAARFALAAGAPVAVLRIAYDHVLLAKGQPWWDVGSHEVTVRLAFSGTLVPQDANTRPAALALSARLRDLMRI